MPGKSVPFYAYWANRYLTFSQRLKNADAAEALRLFLEDLQSRQNIADWQIQQAKEAIQLYTTHFHGGKAAGAAGDDIKATSGPFDPNLVMASMQKAIRVKHYSLSTERTYMDWGSHGGHILICQKSNSLVPILPAGHRDISLNCYTEQPEPLPYRQ